MPPLRYSILGVLVDSTNYTQATAAVIAAAREKRRLKVSALAVHGVMTGATDPVHQTRLNSFDLVTPDGQPVRWALNWLYQTRLKDRVYGPFLTRAICARAAELGLSVFFYGSDASTLAALVAKLRADYPSLIVAGTRASRFRRATETEWIEDIASLRAAAPDIIFCGLGCPRQEIWVDEMGQSISAPLLAVGAAFPFLAGRLAMAPAWMQRRGLEWLYRLSKEPRRLWRRYFNYNPRFALGVLRQKWGANYEIQPSAPEPVAERWS